MTSQKRAFICHSTRDKQFVDQLATNLKSYGVDVWYDKWVMQVGDSLHAKISEGIQNSHFMVAVISEDSLRSKWVMRELNAALARELELQKVFILPVFLSGADELLPIFLKDKLYADFRVSLDAGLTALLSAITGTQHKCVRFERVPDENAWQEVWKSIPEDVEKTLRWFIQQIDNPSGLAFFERHSHTRSGYEAMCEIDCEASLINYLEHWHLITVTSSAIWPDVARHMKLAANLTRLGYRIGQQFGIEELSHIDFDTLPSR